MTGHSVSKQIEVFFVKLGPQLALNPCRNEIFDYIESLRISR